MEAFYILFGLMAAWMAALVARYEAREWKEFVKQARRDGFMEKQFKAWVNDLNEVAKKHGDIDYVTLGNESAWREYFEEGYTPEDAYREDLSHA